MSQRRRIVEQCSGPGQDCWSLSPVSQQSFSPVSQQSFSPVSQQSFSPVSQQSCHLHMHTLKHIHSMLSSVASTNHFICCIISTLLLVIRRFLNFSICSVFGFLNPSRTAVSVLKKKVLKVFK